MVSSRLLFSCFAFLLALVGQTGAEVAGGAKAAVCPALKLQMVPAIMTKLSMRRSIFLGDDNDDGDNDGTWGGEGAHGPTEITKVSSRRKHNLLLLDNGNNVRQILAIGGSMTCGADLQNPKQSWPYVVKRYLQPALKDVSVHILCSSGYGTENWLMSTVLWIELNKTSYDLILIETTINDIGRYGEEPSYPGIFQRFVTRSDPVVIIEDTECY